MYAHVDNDLVRSVVHLVRAVPHVGSGRVPTNDLEQVEQRGVVELCYKRGEPHGLCGGQEHKTVVDVVVGGVGVQRSKEAVVRLGFVPVYYEYGVAVADQNGGQRVVVGLGHQGSLDLLRAVLSARVQRRDRNDLVVVKQLLL